MKSRSLRTVGLILVVVAVGLAGCRKPPETITQSKFVGSMQNFAQIIDAALASLNLPAQWSSQGTGTSSGSGSDGAHTNLSFQGSFTIGKDRTSATQPSKETLTSLVDAIIKECQAKLKDAGLTVKSIEKTMQPGGEGPRIIIRYTGESTTGRVRIDITPGKSTHITMELKEEVEE